VGCCETCCPGADDSGALLHGEWNILGWAAGVGESPVRENMSLIVCLVFPSSSELVEFAVNLPGPPGKPKYFLKTDSGRVP
jgi:hypothetical protein